MAEKTANCDRKPKRRSPEVTTERPDVKELREGSQRLSELFLTRYEAKKRVRRARPAGARPLVSRSRSLGDSRSRSLSLSEGRSRGAVSVAVAVSVSVRVAVTVAVALQSQSQSQSQ